MKKEQLKKLYIESKNRENNEFFYFILKRKLKNVLSVFGFEVDCVGARENLGSKRKKIIINTTTVILRRGKELYITRRINAIIDFVFSQTPDENDLFNIIYNRV